MRVEKSPSQRQPLSFLSTACGLTLLLLCLAATAAGQSDKQPRRGFHPGGTYAVSDIETISNTGGNLMFNIPLASLPTGRGGSPGESLSLFYNSKVWDPEPVLMPSPTSMSQMYMRTFLKKSNDGNWRYGVGYELEIIDKRYEYRYPYGGGPDCRTDFTNASKVIKVRMKTPDGGAHDFRPAYLAEYTWERDGYFQKHPNGRILRCENCSNCPQDWAVMNEGTPTFEPISYYSADGTYIRLDIRFAPPDAFGMRNMYWTMYFPDGRRVTTEPHVNPSLAAQRIYDRNGNYTEITHTTHNGHPAKKIQDQLGRYIIIESDPNTGRQYVHARGRGGEPLVWTVTWKTITVNKTFDSGDYFDPSFQQTINWSLSVVDQIIMPPQAGGLAYTFEYNAGTDNPSHGWGEVSAVTLPSGARVAYTYRNDGLQSIKSAAVLMNHVTRKDLTYASEYDDAGGQITDTWRYSIAGSDSLYYSYVTTSSMTMPDGGRSTQHFYNTQAGSSSWDGHLAGRVYKTERADGTVVELLWAVNTVTGPNYMIHERANPYIKTEFTSVRDAAGNLTRTAIKDYSYDKNGNVTRVAEYDWVNYGDVPRASSNIDQTVRPTGVPHNAPLKRVTVNTYHAPTPDASSTADSAYAYDNPSAPPLRNAVAATEVRDGGGVPFARTEYTYDDAGTTGNMTLRRSWDSTKGALLGTALTAVRLDAGNSVTLRREYDDNTADPALRFGNLTLAVDGRGVREKYAYGAVVSPDGATFNGLYATGVVSAEGTSVQRNASTAYDFSTGLVTKVTDEDNHVSTSTTYDALGRPTLVEEADDARDVNNVSLERRTVNEYSDAARRIITHSDLNSTGDGRLVTVRHFDQLGRVRLTRTLEAPSPQGETDEHAGIKVQTRYANGSAPSDPHSYTLVSTPYRAAISADAGAEPSMGWRRTKMDAGNRVVEVQTFAGASLPAPWGTSAAGTGKVQTAYDAEYTTVTDQANRPRRSAADGLGRLARVDEADGSSNLGTTGAPVQATYYTYDPLGNLRQVEQGGQFRFFMHDSLSRLIRAKIPEQEAGSAASNLSDPVTGNAQWSLAYGYDDNGNLKKRVDARNVTTDFGYDELNRNTSAVYTGEAGTQTPPVTRLYDGAALGKGRPWKTETGQNALTTVEEYDPAGRPLRLNRKFWTGTAWGAAYPVGYSYDLAGNVRSLSYPSGHSAGYSYDDAGRLSDFTGSLGDGAPRTYAGAAVYDAAGRRRQERFGTQTPLYHKHLYNNRGQLAEIRVSTYSLLGADHQTDWNRGAIINFYSTSGWGATGGGPDNNGNLLMQEVFIPRGDDPDVSGWDLSTASYGYDSLNRLEWAKESRGGVERWRQQYEYDRWGNRTVNAGGTWLGNSSNPPSASVNEKQYDEVDLQHTNRLYAPGDTALLMDARRMRYDKAGNLTHDEHGGKGTRVYDGENRMVSAQINATQSATYAYDADGSRVRRNAGSGEVWQVYGLTGELLAEYAAHAPPEQPQKEYGYRGGELLITATAASAGWGPPPVINENPLAVGQTVVRSQHVTELRDAINVLRARRNMAAYQWQTTAAPGSFIKAAPIEEMRTALDQTLGAPPGGHSAGLAPGQPIRAAHIQQLRDRVLGAWQGGSGGSDVRWLVSDHLGTPRMILDGTGSLAGVSRHDYLPFGEELTEGVGGRTPEMGYAKTDGNRKQWATYERDDETKLDFAQARYYGSEMGRFTGIDPGPFTPADPQNWNRYAYVQNNPLKFTDPSGETLYITGRYADYIVKDLERFTGYKLKRNKKTGEVTIDTSVKRNEKGTSEALANKLSEVIGDSVKVKVKTGANQPRVFNDSFEGRKLDVADYKVSKTAAPEFAARLLGHVLEEYYQAEKQYSALPADEQYNRAHGDAVVFESRVLSDFTGKTEQTRTNVQVNNNTLRYVYTSVTYDVITKTGIGKDTSQSRVVRVVKNFVRTGTP